MGPTTIEVRAGLARTVLVGLGAHGWLVPGRRGEASVPLDAARLDLLCALAGPDSAAPDDEARRTAAAHDADPTDLLGLVDELRARGLLQDGAARPLDDPTGVHEAPAAPPADAKAVWQVPVPVTLQPTAAGLRWIDPVSGSALVLSPLERRVAQLLVRPQRADAVANQLDVAVEVVADAVGRLAGCGMAVPLEGAGDGPVLGTSDVLRRDELDRNRALFRAVSAREDERTPLDRPSVVPVSYPPHIQPTALGLILAYAEVHDGGRLAEQYDLRPRWQVSAGSLDRVLAETGPAVFLFSDYVWSSDRLLELSRLVKSASPRSITVHGGPDVPKHEADLREWMARHPHVDVAVRNEGEVTTAEVLAALDGRIEERDGDLSVLADVAGLTYRAPDGSLVRTEDRDRIADLDVVPSPFLTGLFDPWLEAGTAMAVLETNRGCPYGCTFCDWGSATLSRIRKFDLDRVFAELEWVGRARASRLQVADANFGIYERDVEIARKLADVRRATGYPREVFISFAKNTTKYTEQIIRILVEAGVITTGVISLQTTDPDTLEAVHRKNIRTDKYHELARVFREERLPLIIDMMYGLPGQSTAGFRGDLQHCVELEVPPRLYRTEVLVNSPMNDPEYRERYQIHTEDVWAEEPLDLKRSKRRRRLILSSSTFTAGDLEDMTRLGDTFGILENYGLSRYLARWVRQEQGIAEVDLYERIDAVVRDHPERYPVLHAVLETLHAHAAVPLHWGYLVADLRRFVAEELGVEPSSALDAVLAVHEALLPARGRTFPHVVELPHDVAAWHGAMIDAKESDVLEDWTSTVPRLATFGPATFVVDDPHDVCRGAMGSPVDIKLGDNWELEAPVSRANLAYRRA